MNLQGQINASCESRPGHPQLRHWSAWIMLECSYKMDFSSCAIMLGFGKSSHIYDSPDVNYVYMHSCMYIVTACTF